MQVKSLKLLFFFLIVANLPIQAQQHPDVWIDVSVGEDVKIVNDISVYFQKSSKLDSNGNPTIDAIPSYRTMYRFDKEGNQISETLYKDYFYLQENWTASYEEGLMTEKVIYGGDSLPNKKIVFTYDSKNQLTRRETFINKEAAASRLNKHDVQGMMQFISLMKQTSAYDSLAYDEKGNLIAEYAYRNGNNWRTKTWDYTYGKKDRVLTKSSKVNGKEMRKWTHTYDKKGREQERTRIGYGNFEWRSRYKYDELGNVIEESKFTEADAFMDRWEYVYNEENLLVERNQYNVDGVKQASYSYDYDDKGNWTMRTVFLQEEMKSARVRVMEYFE
jgi:hypothetical protein